MTRVLSTALVVLLLPLYGIAQYTFKQTVYFQTDQSAINGQLEKILNKIVEGKEPDRIKKVKIIGHTDSIGSRTYNEKLSNERSLAVRNFLIEKGVSVEKIETQGVAYDRPLVRKTNVDQVSNRRVEIFVAYEKAPPSLSVAKIDKPAAAITMEEFKSSKKFVAKSGKKEPRALQFDENGYVAFYPNLEVETIIKTRSGTSLRLSEDLIKSCNPNQPVEIHLEEYITRDQIIKSNASTYSYGKLLRSIGMVHFTIKGTPFEKTDNHAIQVHVPAQKIPGVRPFVNRGDQDITNINWQPQSESDIVYRPDEKAYAVSVNQVIDGSFSINCDAVIDAEPLLVKVKRGNALQPSPSVVFSDGTVTNLRPLTNPKSKTQYFLFPAVYDQELVIKDLYQSKDLRIQELKTSIQLDKQEIQKLKQKKGKKIKGERVVLLSNVLKYEGV